MRKYLYAIEVASTFSLGLAMLTLLSVSIFGVGLVSLEDPAQQELASTASSIIPSIRSDIADASFEDGQVAGVVDDASVAEVNQRNRLSAWVLSNSEGSVYRDDVLDRTAQNHARRVAASCDTSLLNDWGDSIGTKIEEGFISSYAESIFILRNQAVLFESELPDQDGYGRLFVDLPAIGVGVADAPACGEGAQVATVHLADYR